MLDADRADGYDVDDAVENENLVDGRVRTVDPEHVVVVSMRRLEGSSDPVDELVVAASTIRDGSAPGTVVLRFGPSVSPAEALLLRAADDRRNLADVPGHVPRSDEAARPRVGVRAPRALQLSGQGFRVSRGGYRVRRNYAWSGCEG